MGYGPNISGLYAMSFEIAKNAPKKHYPHLILLMKTWICDDPQALKLECKKFAEKVKDSDIKDSLSRLARAAARAKDQLVIVN